MSWAQRLKRVFGIEIQACVRYRGRLQVIASILAHRDQTSGTSEPELAPLAARAPPQQSALW